MIKEKNTARSQDYAEGIINTIREPLLVLDQSLKVVNAGRSFYDFFKVTPDETIGRQVYDLGDIPWTSSKPKN
jgi:PAS domain-containing protein